MTKCFQKLFYFKHIGWYNLQNNQISLFLLIGPFTVTKTLVAQNPISRDFNFRHYIWLNFMVLPILYFFTIKSVFMWFHLKASKFMLSLKGTKGSHSLKRRPRGNIHLPEFYFQWVPFHWSYHLKIPVNPSCILMTNSTLLAFSSNK